MEKQIKKCVKSTMLKMLLLLLLLVSVCCNLKIPIVCAYNRLSYTDVLDDLQKDSNFNIDKYKEYENNFSLEVIQVAESEDKELFVYVYQPCLDDEYDLRATKISISTGIKDNAKWELYDLSLLDSNQTLFKYVVEDFVVKEDALRYYDISEIFRKYYWFDENEDEYTCDRIVNSTAIPIAELWTASTVENKVSYTCSVTDVVKIENPFNGFIRYFNGYWIFGYTQGDSHFVAFDTDRQIDKLYEADVTFETRYVTNKSTWSEPKINEESAQSHFITINCDQTAENKNVGIFGYNHSWKRIEETAEFIKNEDIPEDVISKIENTKWVLRFFETEYTAVDRLESAGGSLMAGGSLKVPVKYEWSTQVSNVAILRLKFETDGNVYNLGVVSNIQTGSDEPVNPNPPNGGIDLSFFEDFINKISKFFNLIVSNLKYIIYAVVGVVALIILSPFIPVLIQLIITLIINIFKGILWFILLPINLLKK